MFIVYRYIVSIYHHRDIHACHGYVCLLIYCVYIVARYKIPTALFGSHIRSSTILSAIESIQGDIMEIPEACGLHASPEVIIHNIISTSINTTTYISYIFNSFIYLTIH